MTYIFFTALYNKTCAKSIKFNSMMTTLVFCINFYLGKNFSEIIYSGEEQFNYMHSVKKIWEKI